MFQDIAHQGSCPKNVKMLFSFRWISISYCSWDQMTKKLTKHKEKRSKIWYCWDYGWEILALLSKTQDIPYISSELFKCPVARRFPQVLWGRYSVTKMVLLGIKETVNMKQGTADYLYICKAVKPLHVPDSNQIFMMLNRAANRDNCY